MAETLTVPDLAAMKQAGRKVVGVVAYDYQMARIVDRAGIDLVSAGDSVGMKLWGHASPFEVTLDEMVIVARAVRRGVERAVVSCDFPYGPLQEGTVAACGAAQRLVEEAGVDMVKLDDAADHLEAVAAITDAGIPVFAQFGITPHTAARYGVSPSEVTGAGAQVPDTMQAELVAAARSLEEAGAALLDFTNSGPVVGPAVVASVSIPVLGGVGGGPWLDGRMRMAHGAIGYGADALDGPDADYANVARTALAAIREYADDVRAGRQIKRG